MTNVSTERLEDLIQWYQATPHPRDVHTVSALRELLSLRSQQEPAGVVKVKPLFWEEDEIGWWTARPSAITGGFGYEVRVTDSGKVRFRRGREDWASFDGTLEDAKAAAEADYRQRIMSALEPQQEEAVAWQRRIKYPSIPGETPQWEQCSWREATGHFERSPVHEYRPLYAHPTPVQKVRESQPLTSPPDAGGGELARYRHRKRGTEYELLGIGKMQAEVWHHLLPGDGEITMKDLPSVDMREVAIYRSVTDPAEIWVRPREEFEDRRFELVSPAAPSPFPKGEEPVQVSEEMKRLRQAVLTAMDHAGTMPAREAVKVRPKDWRAITDGVLGLTAALSASHREGE